MKPVDVTVIPGVNVNVLKYGYPKDGHIEDYSLVSMNIRRQGKAYQASFYIKNSALPLTTKQLTDIRIVANRKLEATK